MEIWDYGPGNFAFLLDDELDKKTTADIDLVRHLLCGCVISRKSVIRTPQLV